VSLFLRQVEITNSHTHTRTGTNQVTCVRVSPTCCCNFNWPKAFRWNPETAPYVLAIVEKSLFWQNVKQLKSNR